MSGATREHWGSRLGFVMAAVGSAVGLGNMWRFSYLTAEHGGAAFVLLYLAMTAVVGLPLMLAELAVGRGAARSPVQALAHFGGPAWRPLGWLFVASGFLILAYYSVIAGWTLRYALLGIAGGFAGDAAARFGELATGLDAVAWHALFMALTIGVVAGGVKGGIERANLVLMPLLFVILVGLALYAASLDGASRGYRYYLLRTDFAEVLSISVLCQAAGQAFFSLSLGMGAMLTYASYLDREHHLPNESLQIVGSDFTIAFVAGLVVFPLIFALGLEGAVGDSTIGALFITLPTAFAGMGGAGRVAGILFFLALLVGALTSAISLLEQVVATAMDVLGWPRRRAAVRLGVAIGVLGVPAALHLGVLGLMDQLAGNVFLVVGALALCIFVGWVMEDPVAEVRVGAPGIRWFFLWRGLLRFVAPPVLAVVLVYSARDLLGAIAALLGTLRGLPGAGG
jgi:NSS family neurotransmitter:Na+ symporter